MQILPGALRSFPSLVVILLFCALVGVGTPIVAQEPAQAVQPWLPETFAALLHVRDVAIAPDGSEAYVSMQSYRKEFSAILRMEWTGSEWGEPSVASFSGQFVDIEPAFSPDGMRLYFASTRPLHPDSGAPKDYDIWYVDRSSADGPWSAPRRLPPPVNSDKNEFYPSVALNGNLYLTRAAGEQGQQEDIFVCRPVGDGFAEPEPLSDAVNSKRWEFNAYVAPDESYLIFTSFGRPDDLGGGDLYVSVRAADGTWQPARHLGPDINSNRIDYCPFVDGRTGIFYFTSERSSMPSFFEAPMDMTALLNAFARAPVGSGRIYRAPVGTLFK